MVDARISASEESSGGMLKAQEVEVNVLTHHMQRYAVWFGGSVLASSPDFYKSAHTKADYEEWGPNIARTNITNFRHL